MATSVLTSPSLAQAKTGTGKTIGFLLPVVQNILCLLYTSPSPRDGLLSRMPSSA